MNLITTNSVFRKTYYNDFVALIHDCFNWRDGEHPTFYQDEILSEFLNNKRVAVRGPHGLGKTAMAAWLILAFCLTRDGEDFKVPTTASSWRQLTKYLWPEIHKWSRRIRWNKVGREPYRKDKELLSLAIKTLTGEAFAVASSDPELIEGAHADQLCYVFDESKAIPDETWDAAEGAFAQGNCYSFSISTPGDRTGRFYEIHRRAPGYESWYTRHVTLEESIKAGRISSEWVKEKRDQWGEDSPVFQARVLGEFPEHSDDSLISLSWVERARENDFAPDGREIAGQDVARFGSDDSVYTIAIGNCVMEMNIIHGHDTMSVAGQIKAKKIFTKTLPGK